MTDMPDQSDIEQEFDAFLRRAGLVVSADRREILLADYRDLRAMLARLHQPRPGASETAFVFTAESLQRSLRERP